FTSFTVTCASSNGGIGRGASGPGSPIHVTGLTNGKTYTCTVTATSANGTRDPSNPSQAFVPSVGSQSGPNPPGPPSHLHRAKVKSGQLKVSFAAPKDDGGATITKYSAACTSSNGGVKKVGVRANPAKSPVLVTKLTAGKKYTCIVRASNSAGASP